MALLQLEVVLFVLLVAQLLVQKSLLLEGDIRVGVDVADLYVLIVGPLGGFLAVAGPWLELAQVHAVAVLSRDFPDLVILLTRASCFFSVSFFLLLRFFLRVSIAEPSAEVIAPSALLLLGLFRLFDVLRRLRDFCLDHLALAVISCAMRWGLPLSVHICLRMLNLVNELAVKLREVLLLILRRLKLIHGDGWQKGCTCAAETLLVVNLAVADCQVDLLAMTLPEC